MPNMYGVCIGINNYPGSGNDLSGCVNDANDVMTEMVARGYAQVQTLLDSEATRQNVIDVLTEGVAKLHYQDTLVGHYSGHGSYVPDTSGDEADQRDEVWVNYDFQDRGFILDDELYEIFQQRSFGTRVIILSDSCFSGTVSKLVDLTPDEKAEWGLDGEKIESGEVKVRFMPPSHFLDGKELEAAKQVERTTKTSKPRSGAVLISGCKEDEYSYDAWYTSNGVRRANGAFTRNAIDQLHMQSPQTIKQWYDDIRQVLPSTQYPQTPVLTATYHQRGWMI